MTSYENAAFSRVADAHKNIFQMKIVDSVSRFVVAAEIPRIFGVVVFHVLSAVPCHVMLTFPLLRSRIILTVVHCSRKVEGTENAVMEVAKGNFDKLKFGILHLFKLSPFFFL
ncbi:hypothetical protein PUN28_005166 [Cardiocondyla obscurior]|uniref:Uncharacterized protein n=1 Tax=Cardiocondyla obscurior TaxID=286306 RepID=A0AAW2GF21_9HYME